ncbi:142_t:CDS:2 [Dentiscutata erythropus]|uniref:142_t:CDS:1 n=1 Tax=Dentiscutata erythropus TaxID=1348616 RepID=A0A9N9I7Z2_9GLOM|nr:142_t:CDS:2 [Dentiscutata erythropus]
MGSQDTTIPVYKGAEVDDIEDFLFDYEGYAKAKKYDEETTCFRVYMHMPESSRAWVQKIVQTEKTWDNLKKENCRSGEKESVREYTNRYKAYAEVAGNKLRADEKRDWYVQGLKEPYQSKIESHCPKNYDKAKKKALEMGEYKRDKDLNKNNSFTGPDETAQSNKADMDIDSIVNRLAALSINRVEREEKLNRNEVEDMVKSLEGHIIKDCPKRDKENVQTNKGLDETYKDDSTQRIIHKVKNGHNLEAREVKPINCGNLNGLSFYGRISYWEAKNEQNDGTILGNDTYRSINEKGL